MKQYLFMLIVTICTACSGPVSKQTIVPVEVTHQKYDYDYYSVRNYEKNTIDEVFKRFHNDSNLTNDSLVVKSIEMMVVASSIPEIKYYTLFQRNLLDSLEIIFVERYKNRNPKLVTDILLIVKSADSIQQCMLVYKDNNVNIPGMGMDEKGFAFNGEHLFIETFSSNKDSSFLVEEVEYIEAKYQMKKYVLNDGIFVFDTLLFEYFPTCYANGASWIDNPYSTDVINFIDSLKQR